jgi:hypothetical protein
VKELGEEKKWNEKEMRQMLTNPHLFEKEYVSVSLSFYSSASQT